MSTWHPGTGNPLDRELKRLKAADEATEADRRMDIMDKIFFAHIMLRMDNDPDVFRERVKTLHAMIGEWLEG